MDSSAGASAELGRGIIKKLKNINLPQKEDNNVDPVLFCTTRQLCEDELFLIFCNVVISTQDLLNFRLVNKVWCAAATTCLRQRDTSLICITLQRRIPAVPQEDSNGQDNETSKKAFELISCRHKYKDSASTQLRKLINTMSDSAKFPSTNVHLHWNGSNAPNYSKHPDLLLFFKLHGSKIKTLCPHGVISHELLSDILFIYLPKLERLDLSNAVLKYSGEKDVVDSLTTKRSTLGSFPLKSLVLGDFFCGNLSPLLSPPFKLSSIHNVNLDFLPILLKQDEANFRLVASINFHPRYYNFKEALPLMQKVLFSGECPKLTELTLILDKFRSAWFLPSLAQMNKLFSSSEDSLENLKIYIYSSLYSYRNKLRIPPMKNLKCLTFSGCHQVYRVDEGERGDIISIFKLQDEISPQKYFPSLVKVRLEKMDLRSSNNFVWLFKFKPEFEVTIFSGYFSNVETLELVDPLLPQIPHNKFFSACFPNVRILKTVWRWKWTRSLECSFWVMCPLVEFMEIYDDSDDSPSNHNNIDNEYSIAYRQLNIDMFFTGLPRDLCSKMSKETLSQHMNNPVTWNFLRITPSICDLKCLKEFKLKFLQRPLTKVASHVIQAYAFAQMPNTKFILEDDSYPHQSNAAAFDNAETKLAPGILKITPHNILPSDETENIDENIRVTSVIDLCRDELATILCHVPISAKDLLTLRLVSKLWRDVATEILLQRESYYITLHIQKVRVAEIEYYDSRSGNKFFVDKYGQKETPQLSALTELITRSPKFPSSHLHLHSDADDASNYDDYSDLLQFFRLHGRKIKTLRHYGFLSTKDLWDTLFSYAPALECLDLSKAKLRFIPKTNDYSSRFSEVAAPTTERPHTLTSLVFSYDLLVLDVDDEAFGELIHNLLSLSSNLGRIGNVNIMTLAHILKEGKGHLIKSFRYVMEGDTFEIFKMHYSLMKQFAFASPKLCTLVLDLEDPKLYNAIVASVNAILESSKDTLQDLKVAIAPFEYRSKLKIPPMKNLKSITLNSSPSPQALLWRADREFVGSRTSVFLLEDDVCGPEYFPRLLNVVLKGQDFREVKENFLSFFNFQSHDGNDDDDRNGNYFPTVASLEMLNSSCLPRLSIARRISVLFPNVRVMKIKWDFPDLQNLKGSLWVLSPLVEFMEIYDVDNSKYQPETFVDMFFTGFSKEIITKLRTAHSEIPQSMNNPETWDFLRTAPSICHLRHLKEFKLKFLKGCLTQFASRVTGEFAFAQMPSTKFIISYDPETFFKLAGYISKVKDDPEQFLCFSSISPYAQVVCEKRIDYRLMKSYS